MNVIINISRSARPVFFLAIFCLVVTIFAACTAPQNEEIADQEALQAPAKVFDPALEKARNLWESKSIKNYDMIFFGEMPGDKISVRNVRIRIREDRPPLVLSASMQDRGTTSPWEGLETIDDIFDALQRGRNAGTNKDIVVEYNKEFGYPRKVRMNTGAVFEVKKFRVAKKDEELLIQE